MLAFALPALLAAAVTAAPAPSSVCPTSDRTPVVSRAPGAGRSLVPGGAVSLTVCRYSGLPGAPQSARGVPANTLVAVGTTGNRATITRVTAELDAIRPGRRGVVVYGCPADFGTKLLAFFAYRSRPGDVVTIDLSGCNTITNGRLRRLGRDAPVIGRLTGLAEPVAGAGSPPGQPTPPPGEPPPVPIWEPAGN